MTAGPIGLLPRLTRPSGPGTVAARSAGVVHSPLRRTLTFVLFVVAVLVLWEAVKWFGGVPWRFENVFGTGQDLFHDPPFRWAFANDLNLPHWFNILAVLGQPVQRGSEESLLQYLGGAAFYTWREAAIGFVVGGLLGLTLATIFVHSRLLERAFVPYVVASQTIPIVALAPMIVYAFGPSVASVVIIATYLTFFPVTVAMIRGLRSPDPRALELMRSYASTRWATYRKVRFPASLPYLFTALKIAATASIVGAIIGEGPGGVPDGLGRAIINFNQYYITGPEKLWGSILVSALVGIIFFTVIRIAEMVTLRGRPDAAGS
ncbi:MAG: ABC transporter permease [Chloroflexota bacterium]|jgi:NitT/TauT family transport system permease protein|nr:ABC transporter permease [Chloroflexota bacterium]MDH5243627.1 ABC transporter permease [Chloroflexota bacterium]